VTLMVGREVDGGRTAPKSAKTNDAPAALEIRGLSLKRAEAGHALSDVTLDVAAGEIVAICGAMGSGRTALLSTLFGAAQTEARGDVKIAGEAGIPDSPRDAIRRGAALLPEDRKQKVVLGKWLERPPRLLLLDEPTRGVDVGAREEIYTLLRTLAARGTGVLFASSDLEEVVRLAERVVVLRLGRVVGMLTGADITEARVVDLATGAATEAAALAPAPDLPRDRPSNLSMEEPCAS
jgi:ABC-type sugar transport system ATPase subunit